MEGGERDVLFHKTIFIFGPCGAKYKNFEPATLAPGLMGPKNFFASKKFLSSLTLAQLSMQASKVVAAKSGQIFKGKCYVILLWYYY